MANLKFPNIIPSSEEWEKMRDLEIVTDSVSARKSCPVLYKERWKLQTWWDRFRKVSEPYVRENSEILRSYILRECNYISWWREKIKCERIISFHGGQSLKDVTNSVWITFLNTNITRRLTEVFRLCINKLVYCIIYHQYTTIYQYSDTIYTIRSCYGYMFRP